MKALDWALCEGNTTACDPSLTMSKVMSTEILNEVRMFVLSFLNTDEDRHRLAHEDMKKAHEEGLLPTVKQVRMFGEEVFDHTSVSAVGEKIKDITEEFFKFKDGFKVKRKEAGREEVTLKTRTNVDMDQDSSDDGKKAAEDALNEEKIVGEMLPAESLLQVNKRSALRSRALLHKLDVGKKGKGGEKCKKNDDCQSNKCIKNTFSANKCDFEEGRKRQGGEECKKNDDCQFNKCIENTFSANKCGFEEGKAGGICETDEECASKKCWKTTRFHSKGKCTFPPSSVKGGDLCDHDMECENAKCEFQIMQPGYYGICRRKDVPTGGGCYYNMLYNSECAGSTTCIDNGLVGQGHCSFPLDSPVLWGKQSCRYDKECLSGLCAGNFLGRYDGFCLKQTSLGGSECNDNRECLSKLGCSTIVSHGYGTTRVYHPKEYKEAMESLKNIHALQHPDQKDMSEKLLDTDKIWQGYEGTCYYRKGARERDESCDKDDECKT